jgi:biotin carboxylase
VDNVILLDTNVSSAPIYEYLRSEGYAVHVVGRNPADFLAKAADNYVNLDYSDVEATLALVERLDARFLIPGCNDLSYETCAAISARRPFPGIDPPDAVQILGNKREFRRYAAQKGLPAPRELAPEDAVAGRPIIVKPVDAYSGRGVTALKATDQAEIDAATSRAREYSPSGACIIEEFVEGQLYSHTAFLGEQGIVADFIVEEHGSINPFTVDTSCVVFDFDAAMLRAVRDAIEQIAGDLALRSGLIHTQFIANGGAFWIVEITRRCPGDLYSLLISLSTGFPYAENYARPFIGQPFRGAGGERNDLMRHTISVDREMSFGSLQFHRPLAIEKFLPLALAGDRMHPSPFGRIGLLFARATSSNDLRELMQTTLRGELYTVLS